MPIFNVVLVLVVVGVLLWAVYSYIPMAEPIKKLITAVVVIALVVWLLRVFGLIGYLSQFRI
jgi:hypothetical protein